MRVGRGEVDAKVEGEEDGVEDVRRSLGDDWGGTNSSPGGSKDVRNVLSRCVAVEINDSL